MGLELPPKLTQNRGFQKKGSTFHGDAKSPLFKGIPGVLYARGRFTLLSQCFHVGVMAEG
jgi:hypothetical protein